MKHFGDNYLNRWLAFRGDDDEHANIGFEPTRLLDVVAWAEQQQVRLMRDSARQNPVNHH